MLNENGEVDIDLSRMRDESREECIISLLNSRSLGGVMKRDTDF